MEGYLKKWNNELCSCKLLSYILGCCYLLVMPPTSKPWKIRSIRLLGVWVPSPHPALIWQQSVFLNYMDPTLTTRENVTHVRKVQIMVKSGFDTWKCRLLSLILNSCTLMLKQGAPPCRFIYLINKWMGLVPKEWGLNRNCDCLYGKQKLLFRLEGKCRWSILFFIDVEIGAQDLRESKQALLLVQWQVKLFKSYYIQKLFWDEQKQVCICKGVYSPT